MTLFTILVIIALICAIGAAVPKVSIPLWISVILLCVALLVRSYGA